MEFTRYPTLFNFYSYMRDLKNISELEDVLISYSIYSPDQTT